MNIKLDMDSYLLCRKFADVCRKIVIFCSSPRNLFIARRRCVTLQLLFRCVQVGSVSTVSRVLRRRRRRTLSTSSSVQSHSHAPDSRSTSCEHTTHPPPTAAPAAAVVATRHQCLYSCCIQSPDRVI